MSCGLPAECMAASICVVKRLSFGGGALLVCKNILHLNNFEAFEFEKQNLINALSYWNKFLYKNQIVDLVYLKGLDDQVYENTTA